MTSESKIWDSLKAEYLRQVEKALSSVKHPRSKDVLADVRSHLDQRFVELEPDQRTRENLQTIIAEMGPASDYAELLNPDAVQPSRGVWRKYLLWTSLVAVVIIAAAIILPMTRVAILEQAKHSDTLASEGWQLWRTRKLAEAEKKFKNAVRKDPKNANAWNGLGWSQFNQGKPLNAKVSFEKCLAVNPKHPAALNGLGWIAKGQGETDEAIGHWQKAIEAAPSATAALKGLTTTYMELKRYDKAIKYYEMWLKVEPNNARVKADLERAKSRRPAVELADLPDLIDELSNPNAPRFEALNRIIRIGEPAVPTLIKEMETNNNWQIPMALGAIGDRRAVLPLIKKLKQCDFSPMREVVGEALERITGEKFGNSKEKWQKWWEENRQKGKKFKNEPNLSQRP